MKSPSFTPVPLRSRRDGWTAKRQARFIALLRKGLRPGRAAVEVGMSRQSAYALRNRPGAGGFRQAWDDAVDNALKERMGATPDQYRLALAGIVKPVIYRGRKVGEVRPHNSRLIARLLRAEWAVKERRRRRGEKFCRDSGFCRLPKRKKVWGQDGAD